MKRYLIMSLIGLFIFAGFSRQKYKKGIVIIYHLYYQPIEQDPMPIPGISYTLYANREASLFVPNTSKEMLDRTARLAMIRSGATDSMYVSLQDSILIYKKSNFGKVYRVTKPWHHINWTVTSVQKNIAGYYCYRAIGLQEETLIKRDSTGHTYYPRKTAIIYAWFTPEIPLPFGPAEYYGLPGVVLDAYHTRRHMRFRAEKIEKDVPVEVIKPKKGTIITNENYKHMLRRKWSNLLKRHNMK